ncbi:MAG: hypothetical protein AAGA85_02470 [Bacteroidota bacterium]
MKRILFVLLLGIAGTATAQETFSFDYLEEKLDDSEVNPVDIRKNYFGDDVARKMQHLADEYTWLQEPTPTNPVPQRITEKYWVYNSIKKLQAYYKKAVKRGVVSKDAAVDELIRAADIGLCIRYQNTMELEEYLQTLKKDSDLASLYANNIYLDGSVEYGQALTEANDD